MAWEPAGPSAEGTPVAVDGVDSHALIAEERGLYKDEAEAGRERGVVEEGAELGAEDRSIHATAVQTQDSWEVKCCAWIGSGWTRCI